MSTDGTSSQVARVGMRVPPFCHEDPALWFAQLEGQFAIAGITVDTTKFHHVAAQLEYHIAKEVKDIITNPPADNRYQTLKTELIRRLSASREKELHQLLTHEELGDRKPSQFLRHLQSLAGADVPPEFLRTLWSGRLPPHLLTIVASQAKLSLSELAELADRVDEVVPRATPVAHNSSKTCAVDMSQQISELKLQLASMQKQLHNNPHSTHRARSRGTKFNKNRHRSRSKSTDNTVCWYHATFGSKANKCTAPCMHSNKPAEN